jgi:hypothetical protein
MAITDQQIAAWRKHQGAGMESALGEFTPPEFWEALSEIERLRSVLEWIAENGPDDAWDLRTKARQALEDQ